jgi:hypothetical protein
MKLVNDYDVIPFNFKNEFFANKCLFNLFNNKILKKYLLYLFY